MAISNLLFVDANIWLDFYRVRNDTGLRLLEHTEALSEKLIVTYQLDFMVESPWRALPMYLRLTFWTGAMAYISFLFARFDLGNGHSSPGVMLTAAFFGAFVGFALASMFANRVKRKALLQ